MRRALLFAMITACGGSTPAPQSASTAPRAENGALFNDGDVVAYAVKNKSGTLIGRVHSTYRTGGSADENATVQTRLAIDTGTAGQSEVSMELVTTLRPDGCPAAFKKLSSVGGRYELRFQPRAASIITGEGTREVKYERAPVLPLPRHDMMMLAIAIERSKLEPGSAKKLEVLSPESVEKLELDARAWSDAEKHTVVQLPDAKVTLAESGRVLRFEEADTGFVLELEDPPGAPPKIDPPTEPAKYARPAGAQWSDREVSIDVRDGTLAGTLSEPRIRANLDQKFAPGVIVLSGAGAQDRFGFGQGIDHGTWQLCDRLVEDGFAVLRIDDRGAGASTSKIAPEELGLEVMVNDAAALVAFMRTQPGVDPERIFAVGHGHGGLIALLLAAREPLAGVVLLATPFRTLPELLAAQEVEAHGANRESADREVRLAIMALKGNQASRAQIGPQRLAELATQKQLLIDHGGLDMTKTLDAVSKMDISVFQGMKDFQVSWKDDAKPIVDTLKKQGSKKAKLFVYENVDHLMKEEPSTSSLRRYADRSRRLDPRVLDDLSSWMLTVAKTPRAK